MQVNICQVCQSQIGSLHVVREMMLGTRDEFHYWEGSECGCLFLTEIPEDLGRYYRSYLALMDHWHSVLPGRMHRVFYESVIENTETEVRRLLEYCGLPWDEGCLSFHKSKRTVKTASAVQVRKPLFRSSLQRWRRYQDGLGPLINELSKV